MGVEAFAADNSVFFKIPDTSIAPQTEFSVDILINSKDSINAFDMEVVFPKDKLHLLNFDYKDSIVDIWQSAPVVLPNGNIRMVGGMIKPFVGDNGLLTKINFRSESVGDMNFSFFKDNLYIADGKASLAVVASQSSNVVVENNGSRLQIENYFEDKTPPEIILEQIKDPLSDSLLLTIQASDNDTGIQKIQMRNKQWFTFSSWVDVKNPILYPAGSWKVEIMANSNGGALTVEQIFFKNEIFKKVLSLFVSIFLFVFIFKRVYNIKKMA